MTLPCPEHVPSEKQTLPDETSEKIRLNLSEDIEFFESKIRPLLSKHCYECHSGKSDPIQGALRLDTRTALTKGGDSGTAFNADDPKKRFKDIEKIISLDPDIVFYGISYRE